MAERAVGKSAEAFRIVERKYAGGLASVGERPDAQAVETHSALGFAQARYDAIVAAVERRRALGGDPGSLEALDEARPVAANPWSNTTVSASPDTFSTERRKFA